MVVCVCSSAPFRKLVYHYQALKVPDERVSKLQLVSEKLFEVNFLLKYVWKLTSSSSIVIFDNEIIKNWRLPAKFLHTFGTAAKSMNFGTFVEKYVVGSWLQEQIAYTINKPTV